MGISYILHGAIRKQPFMICISPFAGGGVNPVVVDTIDHLQPIRLELGRSAGKILVNPRLGNRPGNRNHNRCVLARRVFGLVVLGFNVKTVIPYRQDGLLPGLRQAVSSYCNNGYISGRYGSSHLCLLRRV